MEAMLISRAVGILLAKLTTMIDKNKKLRKELKTDLQDIKCEMAMINEAVKKYAEVKELRWWILEVQELAYDIEDKVDEFRGRLNCSTEANWVAKKIHDHKTKGTAARFAEEIHDLKKRARNAYERRNTYLGGGAAPSAPEQHPGPSSINPYVPEDALVGIAEPRQELLELVKATAAGNTERLRVISVLGYHGIGKTTLANVVFHSPAAIEFPCRAWVVASECTDARGLLADLLSQLLLQEKDTTSSLAKLGQDLNNYLRTKQRFLIIIDDIQKEVWGDIKSSFPVDTHGRIIVTTSIQSIAKTCSSDGRFVYRMQALDKFQSKELLLKQVFGSHSHMQCSGGDFEGSEAILAKCDGSPLALVNIAQLLRKSDQLLTRNHCTKVCRDLASHLQTEEALSRMKQVLISSYDNLPDHDLKTCLLSVSIFPKNHQIKRKRLIRRWLAEGLVVKDVSRERDDIACGYFDKLIDRSVIQTVRTSNNARVKTCKIHGIVLDFIVHKSASENFITFIHNKELIANPETTAAVRRLSLHNTTTEKGTMSIDMSRIRSLTIFGHVGDYINFQKCKLLRVLDLEECKELEDNDIKNICSLMQLKYLSLRGTDVNKLPSQVSNLRYLETLDIRETNVKKLPIEVLKLPLLAQLFGKFKLPSQLNKVRDGHKLQTFFSQNSRLQTLAGFVVDQDLGFQQIMFHISKLRKVKLWSEGTPSEDSIDILKSSLQNRFFGENALQSLSINFGKHSMDFLDSLDPPCLLTSVKLHGKLTNLPSFIKTLKELELNLSSTALSNECLLALQSLGHLLYLKLVEDCPEFVNTNFNIQSDGFPRLQRLCIQAQKLPKMTIQERAIPFLVSLQLLCEDISGFPVEYIIQIKGLKEVTLVNTINSDMRKDWETAAKKHENRPEIICVTPVMTPAT